MFLSLKPLIVAIRFILFLVILYKNPGRDVRMVKLLPTVDSMASSMPLLVPIEYSSYPSRINSVLCLVFVFEDRFNLFSLDTHSFKSIMLSYYEFG